MQQLAFGLLIWSMKCFLTEILFFQMVKKPIRTILGFTMWKNTIQQIQISQMQDLGQTISKMFIVLCI